MATEVKSAPKTPSAESKVAAADMFAALKAKAVKVAPATVLVDKKDLIGVPFVIMHWTMVPSTSESENRRTVIYAEVTYVREDGTEGQFRDASKYGIKAQLVNHWGESNPGKAVPTGVIFDEPILCPTGVEARKFKTENRDGKEIESTVYALSV